MRRNAAITALGLGAAAVVVVLILSLGQGGSSAPGSYTVRAIFDNAGFAVAGEQVRIAGAPVGSISSLSVTRRNQAAVTFTVANPAFTPFHADATCAIRPQSLIAERYLDCEPGTVATAPLPLIRRGQGAGAHLLPVTRTSSPIDTDIVQSIAQEPIRQRLAIIVDELGTGLAARGADLGAVIRRADPALAQTDEVFKILAAQDHELAQLASDSDTVLAPLARMRAQIAGFVVHANTVASASAARSAALSRSIKLLPVFLARLRPLMADLGVLADQGTPLMSSLGQAASGLNRQFAALAPFATAARTALIDLGNAAAQAQAPLVATLPLAQRLGSLGAAAKPSGALLDQLTASLNSTGAIGQLMSVLFNGTGATNAFDANGHYVRAAAILGSCTGYARTPTPICSANFQHTAASADSGTAVASSASSQAQSGSSGASSERANSAGSSGPGVHATLSTTALAGSQVTPSAPSARETTAVSDVVRAALRRSAPPPPSALAALVSLLTGGRG
jgi:ABC-type transporter Mla subunit MlaD